MTPTHTMFAASIAAASGPWLRNHILAHGVGRCPRCHTPLATSWPSRLPTTGRCPLCRRRIGPTTGAIEQIAAATAVILAWYTITALIFATLLWIAWHHRSLSYVDIAVHRLRECLTVLAFLSAIILLAAAAASTGDWGQLVGAVADAIVTVGFYLTILTTPGCLGHSDAKFAPTAGLVLTWCNPAAAVTGLIANVATSAMVGLFLATRQVQRQQAIAHGPIVLSGTLTAFLVAT